MLLSVCWHDGVPVDGLDGSCCGIGRLCSGFSVALVPDHLPVTLVLPTVTYSHYFCTYYLQILPPQAASFTHPQCQSAPFKLWSGWLFDGICFPLLIDLSGIGVLLVAVFPAICSHGSSLLLYYVCLIWLSSYGNLLARELPILHPSRAACSS